jgi:uncharacterized protein YjbI with pentapeptide repeats
MANAEHIAILNKGVVVWNEWREKNPEIKPDLTEIKLNPLKRTLSKLNLNGTNLSGADLSCAYFSETKLSQAVLVEADFKGSYLINADFSGADLSRANLYAVQALGANFIGATFTGAYIENWSIDVTTNLSDVICNYVYLREEQQERRPSSGNFKPGEFIKLFQKVLETVDLIFADGIDWDAFAYSFKKVEVENQGAQLDVQSIEKKGDGVLLVRVSVSLDTDKAKIHSNFMQSYEFAHKALEAQYQARLEDKDKEINRLFYLVNQLSGTPKKVSNYYLPNSQFAGGIVDANTVQSHQIGGDIYNTNNQENPD